MLSASTPEPELSAVVSSFDTVMCDCDGVLYTGPREGKLCQVSGSRIVNTNLCILFKTTHYNHAISVQGYKHVTISLVFGSLVLP